jgi:uncharacterized protein (DUF2252 family)
MDDFLNAVDRRMPADATIAARRATARARAKTSLKALMKLTEQVDGRRRFISAPPLMVRLDDLVDGAEPADVEAQIRALLAVYQRSLEPELRYLLKGYRAVDMARKVVGVGSVGTRAWIVLLVGVDQDDPLVLQAKEAQESVLAPYVGASRLANEGQRVVEGQRLMQAASDILLGWDRVTGFDGQRRDFYIRQLWDGKFSPDVETMPADRLTAYLQACAWTLARGHARSGDRVAIAAYLGKSATFDAAMVEFSRAYADQNERDYAVLTEAVESGRIEAEAGV